MILIRVYPLAAALAMAVLETKSTVSDSGRGFRKVCSKHQRKGRNTGRDAMAAENDGQYLPPTLRFDVLCPKEWWTPLRQAHE